MKMQKLMENWRRYLKEEEAAAQKPKLFFLIGPPAVGKSSWIKQNAPSDAVVINRDEMVEQIAGKAGLTYDDMYARPPKEKTPPGMITKEIIMDQSKQGEVENYINKVAQAAEEFNNDPANADSVKKYGKLIPFNKESFELVLVKFGVKPEFIVPFEFEKIKNSNDEVTATLDLSRKQSAKQKKSIIIDMVNMSINERNLHRKFLVASIEDLESPNAAKPEDINKYYDQVAIVFSPKEGFSDELRKQIKDVAVKRAEEIKASGGSKTIPPQAYDRMFSNYQPPTPEENFKEIKFVGVPSLVKLGQAAPAEAPNKPAPVSERKYISKKHLKQIIKEELQKVLREGDLFTSDQALISRFEDTIEALADASNESYDWEIDDVVMDGRYKEIMTKAKNRKAVFVPGEGLTQPMTFERLLEELKKSFPNVAEKLAQMAQQTKESAEEDQAGEDMTRQDLEDPFGYGN